MSIFDNQIRWGSSMRYIGLNVLVFLIVHSCNMKQKVDVIVFNSVVLTVDKQFSIAEAFAIQDGYFVDVGTNEKIRKKYRADMIIDAGGMTIMPGLFDSHCHFVYHGLNKYQYIDLSDCDSFEALLQKLNASSHLYRSEWIVGRGWDQHKLGFPEMPSRWMLDRFFPDKPVFLLRIDGHAAWVNSEALKRAKIHSCRSVEGGIVICEHGIPTGILLDNAIHLVSQLIPPPERSILSRAILDTQKECLSYGLTTVVDAGLKPADIELLDSLEKTGDLRIRVYVMLDAQSDNVQEILEKGIRVDEYLTVRALKIYADGAMGSRGACLLQPYADDPQNYGLITIERQKFVQYCRLALENGWQVATHAIGDSAVRYVLDVYSDVLPENNDFRWRIEHVQLFHPDDLYKFEKYRIVPSVQPSHLLSDMVWIEQRLGKERLKFAYAWKTLLEHSGWICSGTDFPVEPIHPMRTLYASLMRVPYDQHFGGEFFQKQRLTFEEAIRAMTIWAAKACFVENYRGSIEKGKVADFVILDKNLLELSYHIIPDVKVLSTWIAGQKVYERGID